MATRKYISNIEASYFIDHKLQCLPAPPSTGSYKVGDVVISSHQDKDIFGWVCIKSGEPGTWQAIADVSQMKANIKSLQDETKIQENDISILRQRVEKDYDELKEKDVSHDETIAGMNSQIQTNIQNINKLIADVSLIGGNNTSLGTELRDIINALTGKVETNISNILLNKNDIKDLKASNTTNIANINANTNDITQLKTKVDNNTENITKNTSSIENIMLIIESLDIPEEVDLSGVLSQLNTNAASIAKNTGDIGKLREDLDGLEIPDLTQITEKVDENFNNINEISDLLSNMYIPEEINLTELINKVDVNESNINKNGKEITQIKTDLTEADNKINKNIEDIIKLREDLDGLEIPDLTDVNAKVAKNTEDITKNVEDIIQLRLDLDSLDIPEEVDLSEVNRKISANTENIGDLNDALRNHTHEGFSLSDHNHDGVYAIKTHDHNNDYAVKTHKHDDDYAVKTHDHDDNYAIKTHNHNSSYAPKTHTHEGMLTYWVGTQAQYDTLTEKDPNKLYIITD